MLITVRNVITFQAEFLIFFCSFIVNIYSHVEFKLNLKNNELMLIFAILTDPDPKTKSNKHCMSQ